MYSFSCHNLNSVDQKYDFRKKWCHHNYLSINAVWPCVTFRLEMWEILTKWIVHVSACSYMYMHVQCTYLHVPLEKYVFNGIRMSHLFRGSQDLFWSERHWAIAGAHAVHKCSGGLLVRCRHQVPTTFLHWEEKKLQVRTLYCSV